jgi:hypothetical protein
MTSHCHHAQTGSAAGPLNGGQPPARSTRPSASRTAVALSRGTRVDPVKVHWPVAGLYSSAELRYLVQVGGPCDPVATSTSR